MDMFKTLIIILLSSVLVDNYVLSRFLGICPFLGVSKKLDQATGMGLAVTIVMLTLDEGTTTAEKERKKESNLGILVPDFIMLT